MSPFASVTDADLARGHQDPRFRQRLVAESLEHLLCALNKLRAASVSGGNDPDRDSQLKEGAALAVRLADLLHEIAEVHSQSEPTA
jgi:hypothetical protein